MGKPACKCRYNRCLGWVSGSPRSSTIGSDGWLTEHYRSAELVFGWSFYRQGTSGGTSSADEFLDAALTWFGIQIHGSERRGRRARDLRSSSRIVEPYLVLDGLEPLQNPPGPQEGRVREPALQALLRELAAFNTGLCVITTRMPVADIADHERTSALRRDLEQLSSDAGAKLLRALGVKGHEAGVAKCQQRVQWPLSGSNLLGSYLTDAYNGDIRRRKEVSERSCCTTYGRELMPEKSWNPTKPGLARVLSCPFSAC